MERRTSSYGLECDKILEFQLVWRDFDLKIGDIIIAPYPVYDGIFKEKIENLEMKVVDIYPHIFIAETIELSPNGRERSKSYRKIDYCMRYINKKK